MRSTFLVAGLCMQLLLSCSKTNVVSQVNCDGLITDTTNTGDTARIYMPNAFSPNGDGYNDIIRPITSGISSISYTVYDNRNNVVFNTNQLFQGWAPNTNNNNYEKFYYKIQAATNSGHQIGICGEIHKLLCFPPDVSRSSLYFEDQLRRDGTYASTTVEIIGNCP